MDAYFHSSGARARTAIVDLLSGLCNGPPEGAVCVHIMIFSFTDRAIADGLLALARRRPSVQVRILADWNQRGHHPSVLPYLVAAAPANMEIRFTRDQPYHWDAECGRLRWSYHLSHGLLHHKTVVVLRDGRPHTLICGSSNWTSHARRSYENSLVLSGAVADEAVVIARIELEFEALWNSGVDTLSVMEADVHYDLLRRQLQADSRPAPQSVKGLAAGRGGSVDALDRTTLSYSESPRTEPLHVPGISIAFSGRLDGKCQRFGYAAENHQRTAVVRGPNGTPKKRRHSLTSLALALIFGAGPGESIWLAIFGLSPRVAEYGALLDAARRGVRLRVLLDDNVGGSMAARLRWIARRESLPIEVRTTNRTMHQKYAIHPEGSSLVTGTANMSADASLRHLEHRLLVRHDPELTESFIYDFEAMWSAESRDSRD